MKSLAQMEDRELEIINNDGLNFRESSPKFRANFSEIRFVILYFCRDEIIISLKERVTLSIPKRRTFFIFPFFC